MDTNQLLPPQCARHDGKEQCVREGLLTCGNCKLVTYCGHECQKAHWSEHRIDCRSPLGKTNWLPEWDLANREPAWASFEASRNLHNPFGSHKHLWGNTPAVDILKLSANEGLGYEKNISILFAASGDLRNLVKTVAEIPEDFKHQVKAVVNDFEFDVVARNAILLLLALILVDNSLPTPPFVLIAEKLIHTWYPAFLPRCVLASLQSKVKPLLKKGWMRAARRPDGTIAKKWVFQSGSTLQLALSEGDWLRLESFLEVPNDLSFELATRVRASVTMASKRADYRDRWYYNELNPKIRLSKKRFREDGVLLPFGHSRAAYRFPNPTLFQTATWPLDDKADPLSGWPVMEVNQTPWRAVNDCYGKLFTYLQHTFGEFLSRLASIEFHFELSNVDATELPQILEPQAYARIDVSNISDVAYLGTYKTLASLGPLLQSEQENSHATLITSYMNAVMEIAKMSGESDSLPDIQFLKDFLPSGLDISNILRQGAGMLRAWDARPIAFDGDRYFEQYIEMQNFREAAKNAKLSMKRNNTIVEKWPLKLKLRPGQLGAQEEFELLLASNSSGVERYVEWQRKRDT